VSRLSKLVIVLALGLRPVSASAAEPPAARRVVLHHCEVDYRRSSLVGVAHMGTSPTSVLQECLVRLGDRVKAGQVLGRIMDRDVRAELELRTAEAANLLELQISETKVDAAANRLSRTQKLQNRNTLYVPAEERVQQELDMTAAKLDVEESKYELRLAEIKRRQAEVLLQSRQYISPHDGVVVEIHKEQGEAVLVAEPIFRVVDADWLRVTGHLNLTDFWRVKEGHQVQIFPEIDGEELPIESEVFSGQIVFVDRRIDPATRTCKVVAEVANRDLLLASGLEARMEIVCESPPAAKAVSEPTRPDARTRPSDPVSRSGGERPPLNLEARRP
jgi:RND family efflux transporter MFP subunit